MQPKNVVTRSIALAAVLLLAWSSQAKAEGIFLGEGTVDLKAGKYRCGMWLVVSGDTVTLKGWEFVRVGGKKVYEDKDHVFLKKSGRDAFKAEYAAGPGKVVIQGHFEVSNGVFFIAEVYFTAAGQKGKVISIRHRVG